MYIHVNRVERWSLPSSISLFFFSVNLLFFVSLVKTHTRAFASLQSNRKPDKGRGNERENSFLGLRMDTPRLDKGCSRTVTKRTCYVLGQVRGDARYAVVLLLVSRDERGRASVKERARKAWSGEKRARAPLPTFSPRPSCPGRQDRVSSYRATVMTIRTYNKHARAP